MTADKICWIDLETTGSRLETSQILEIGVAITDTEGNIQAEQSWLNPAGLDSLRIAELDPVVLKMHAESGLWTDLQKVYTDPLSVHGDPLFMRPGLGSISKDIGTWLIGQNNLRTEHIPLAGSGVSHFDRPFIRRDLPNVDKLLTYWAYDVGVMRRMLRLVGHNSQTEETLPTHRALEDVKAHIAEFRIQLEYLRNINYGAIVKVPTGVTFEPLFPGRTTAELVEGRGPE